MNGFEILVRDTLHFWQQYITKAEITIDGVMQEIPIQSKDIDLDKGNIRINIYIQSSEGEIQKVELFNADSEVVRSQTSYLKKGNDGLVVAFSWTLQVEERIAP